MPMPHLTSAHFEQAFRTIRRQDWPSTLDQLEAGSLRFSLVRLRATLIAQGRFPGGAPQGGAASPLPGSSLVRGLERAATRRLDAGVDRKRLSSGDRDD